LAGPLRMRAKPDDTEQSTSLGNTEQSSPLWQH
jgi:hypothetical protein